VTLRHLYVHVPFCARRCSYCDFAIAVRREVPVAEYLGGLGRELQLRRGELENSHLDTLYLGGGTPSRIGAEGIRDLIQLVRQFVAIDESAEVTIEANPDDVSLEAAAAWRASGVNRVSLGVQSFDDSVLAWMHRTHDSAQARNAVRALREAGIENVSIDLIFALPGALRRSWESDLRSALDLEPDHISLYGLTIEPRTPLARWLKAGSVIPAEEDQYATDFLLAHELTAAAGYMHYEVSNFARPGRLSRHNSAYWTGAAYVGLGPSAHSFDGDTRKWNVGAYAQWIDRLAAGSGVEDGREILSVENRRAERVYLGLRTNDGLLAAGDDLERAERWKGERWAEIDGDVVRLTPEGWLRLDSLAAGLTGL
jgi:oxygen-independent coproporphyrinogen III oxidase